MSNLDLQTIEKIANLSRLNFTKEELESFQHDLNEVFTMAEAMQKVDTKGIEPLISPHALAQHLRHDVVTEIANEKELQNMAPAVERGLYLVPKIVDN